jgi:carboxypeptidase family protein
MSHAARLKPARLALGLAALSIALNGQSSGTEVLGQVLDGSSGQPVVGATVSLGLAGPTKPAVTTCDANGRFSFRGVSPGTYGLKASMPGYIDAYLGQWSGDDPVQSLHLVNRQGASEQRLYLWRSGVIAGTVSDEGSGPVVQASVQAFSWSRTGDRIRLAPVAGETRTNDLGQFRLRDLRPGTYVIAVRLRPTQSNSSLRLPTVFHRAALSATEATTVNLRPGEIRNLTDVVLDRREFVHSVSGHVLGGTKSTYMIGLSRSDSGLVQGDPNSLTTTTEADGRFAFNSVPSGQYVVRVADVPQTGIAGASLTTVRMAGPIASTSTLPTLWAEERLFISIQGITETSLRLREGARIKGSLVFAGAGPKPSAGQMAEIPLIVQTADGRDLGNLPLVRVETDGSFSTIQLPPGQYEMSPSRSVMRSKWPSWTVQSIKIDAREVAGRPIDLADRDITNVIVTMTDRPSEISGVIHTMAGASVPNATIYLFPADSTYWFDFAWAPSRLARTRGRDDGTYSIIGLLPGEYFAAALISNSPREWRDSASLRKLMEFATKVQVAPGSRHELNLTARTDR